MFHPTKLKFSNSSPNFFFQFGFSNSGGLYHRPKSRLQRVCGRGADVFLDPSSPYACRNNLNIYICHVPSDHKAFPSDAWVHQAMSPTWFLSSFLTKLRILRVRHSLLGLFDDFKSTDQRSSFLPPQDKRYVLESSSEMLSSNVRQVSINGGTFFD